LESAGLVVVVKKALWWNLLIFPIGQAVIGKQGEIACYCMVVMVVAW
jgi:hypothetical protein